MYSLVFYSLSGYRYLGDGGTDRREILHDGTRRSRTDLLPFWGRYPGIPKSEILGLNFGHLTATISKMVSRSVTCQLAPHQLDEGFLKMCKSQGGSPPGECTPPRMAGLCLADALVCIFTFLLRDPMHKRGLRRHAVFVCLSRLWTLSTKRIIISSNFFSPSCSQVILVFPYQTTCQYSDVNP